MPEKNNPKKSFIFGLITGVAVLAVIGFFIMLGLYLDKDKSVDAVPGGGDKVAVNNQAAPTAGGAEVSVATDDNIRGNQNAPITIVEFSDLQCPYCSKFHTTMQQVMENYPNDVKWVYKHFPLDSIHPYARPAAEASECAGEQGKFWEYTDKLFDNQSSLNQAYLSTAAEQVGLNTSQFESCLSSGKYESKVEADYREGLKLGVTGTPGSFINGQLIPGAVPYEQIESIIESLL